MMKKQNIDLYNWRPDEGSVGGEGLAVSANRAIDPSELEGVRSEGDL